MVTQRVLDKQRTRERIADVATALFLERSFEVVTVAEVAAAAGVSKVTVFAHFPRKEDLLLDRAPEAAALLRAAVLDRGADISPVEALRRLAVRLAEQHHPLSGLRPGAEPFLRTIAASPALLSRVRDWVDELEQSVALALSDDPQPVADPRLLAALVVASYRTVVTLTAERVLAGDPPAEVAAAHVRRLHQAFDALDAAAGTFEVPTT